MLFLNLGPSPLTVFSSRNGLDLRSHHRHGDEFSIVIWNPESYRDTSHRWSVHAEWLQSMSDSVRPYGFQPTRLLCLGFSRQECRVGYQEDDPSPGDLPNPGIEHTSSASPVLASGFFIAEPWAFQHCDTLNIISIKYIKSNDDYFLQSFHEKI